MQEIIRVSDVEKYYGNGDQVTKAVAVSDRIGASEGSLRGRGTTSALMKRAMGRLAALGKHGLRL